MNSMVLNFFNVKRSGKLTRELHPIILMLSSDSSLMRSWISTSFGQFNKRNPLSSFKPDRQDNFPRGVQFDRVSSHRFSSCPNRLRGISFIHDLRSSRLDKFFKLERHENSANELKFISFNIDSVEGSS